MFYLSDEISASPAIRSVALPSKTTRPKPESSWSKLQILMVRLVFL